MLYTVAYVLKGFPKTITEETEYVEMAAATITSMVPQGMVLTATLAFSLGHCHEPARRHRAATQRGRDHGVDRRHLHRQDRHAHDQPSAPGAGARFGG